MIPSFAMNFYWGVGKTSNLGFGYNPPIGISHLTIATYFNSDNDNSQYVFSSINGLPFSINFHPNIEFGGSFVMRENKTTHSIAAGIWIIKNENNAAQWWAYSTMDETKKDTISVKSKKYYRPFFKYHFFYKDVSVNIQNYTNWTKKFLLFRRNDSLKNSEKIEFKNAEIDSIYCDSLNWFGRYIIAKNNGENYILADIRPYDLLFPDIDIRNINQYPFDENTRVYFLLIERESYPYSRSNMYEVNINQIINDFNSGKDFILQYNPENTKVIIDRIKWYKSDWSIGIGRKE